MTGRLNDVARAFRYSPNAPCAPGYCPAVNTPGLLSIHDSLPVEHKNIQSSDFHFEFCKFNSALRIVHLECHLPYTIDESFQIILVGGVTASNMNEGVSLAKRISQGKQSIVTKIILLG